MTETNVDKQEILIEEVLNNNLNEEISNDNLPNDNSEKNDSIIIRDYLSSLVNQGEQIVYYEVENIYSELGSKKYKNKLLLKKDPPTLLIKDNLDNEAVFYLTENLTDELINTLKEVKRAYYGFDSPIDINLPNKWSEKVLYYTKKHPFKILFPIFVILFIIIKTIV